MMAELEIAEDGQAFRMGRNWIRVGDLVDVAPSRPGKRDGFVAELKGIIHGDAGIFADLFGGRKGFAAALRVLPIERVVRKAKATATVDRSLCAPPAPRRGRR